jgi:hypothetical protein
MIHHQACNWSIFILKALVIGLMMAYWSRNKLSNFPLKKKYICKDNLRQLCSLSLVWYLVSWCVSTPRSSKRSSYFSISSQTPQTLLHPPQCMSRTSPIPCPLIIDIDLTWILVLWIPCLIKFNKSLNSNLGHGVVQLVETLPWK